MNESDSNGNVRRAEESRSPEEKLRAREEELAALRPAWTEQLARQIGGTVTLRAEPSLAMSAAYAQRS